MKLKQAKSSAGLAGILLASLVSLTSLDATAADKAVASLGAVSVPDGELQKMLEAMPATERAAVKGNRPGVENWLRQRVVSEVVLREARSKGWADRPEIKARVDAAVKDITARIVRGRVLLISCLDNLVKGASGAAVQNFNCLHGFPESTGML
jgi:peptidylprolyl isomerase